LAHLLEGRQPAEKIKQELKAVVGGMKKPPVLTSVQVGMHDSIVSYVQSQRKCADFIGIEYRALVLEEKAAESDVIARIVSLNQDPAVNGIIVQLPLPKHLDVKRIVRHISPEKDVEGIPPADICRVMFGERAFLPCTAAAVMEMIASTDISLYGKEAVVVGNSKIVGRPVALMLLEQMATVTVCHIATSEAGRLQYHISGADIVVVAVGKPGVVKGEWIKEGAIVIDVGINRVNDRILGDVEFESASRRAAFITPVPGGVGPLTTALLMRNVVHAGGA
jgi:methylenetetrahydrofolate dehydrogenase (NADP+) / methenyltetrahydrofolate cyclohydrolase